MSRVRAALAIYDAIALAYSTRYHDLNAGFGRQPWSQSRYGEAVEELAEHAANLIATAALADGVAIAEANAYNFAQDGTVGVEGHASAVAAEAVDSARETMIAALRAQVTP